MSMQVTDFEWLDKRYIKSRPPWKSLRTGEMINRTGFYMDEYSSGNIIKNNQAGNIWSNNQNVGIIIYDYSDYNVISGNNFSSNYI